MAVLFVRVFRSGARIAAGGRITHQADRVAAPLLTIGNVQEDEVMTLEQLLRSVEAGLFNFGRRLCTDRHAEARDEADRVADELRQEQGALHRCREEMAHLRQRVRANEDRATLLTSRVESFVYVHDGRSAYDHALELEKTRQRLADDRKGLRRALARERDYLDAIRELERRSDELHEQLSRR
jgi:hypothetical protein